MPGLSKSRILNGLQCPRRLWLEVHQPNAAEDYSEGIERRLSAGHLVNEVVHGLVPNAYLIDDDIDLGEALLVTERLLRDQPDRPIFEATFRSHDVLVRADVFQRRGDRYHATEVKSSTGVKDYHLTDCAVQTWVIRGAGYDVGTIDLAHIDNTFVYPGGGNYPGLMHHEDVTAQVSDLLPLVPQWVQQCRTAVEGDEPQIKVGDQCSDPFDCPFWDHCAPPPSTYPVTCLPRGGDIAKALQDEGYRDLRDVPVERLTNPTHAWVHQVTHSGIADLKPELGHTLRALAYPRYYIDFETMQFAVPIWVGTRPYEQLPFQWSCHIEQPDGLEHHEYLDTQGSAPMRAFAESLIQTVGGEGPVIVYSPFEKRILNELSDRFPDLANSLQAIVGRLVDLLPLTRAYYYHPDMRGSWSIKAVLPTVAPHLDYGQLEDVRDGTGAQVAYEEMIDHSTDVQRKQQLEQSLLEYCKLDTLAMVELCRAFSLND